MTRAAKRGDSFGRRLRLRLRGPGGRPALAAGPALGHRRRRRHGRLRRWVHGLRQRQPGSACHRLRRARDAARGPVALVTHSGSVFSSMLRTHRRVGFTVAVSSGQELVTTAADYLHYTLERAGDESGGPRPRDPAPSRRLPPRPRPGRRPRHPRRGPHRRCVADRPDHGGGPFRRTGRGRRRLGGRLRRLRRPAGGRSRRDDRHPRALCRRPSGRKAGRRRRDRHRPRLGSRAGAGGGRRPRARCPLRPPGRHDPLATGRHPRTGTGSDQPPRPVGQRRRRPGVIHHRAGLLGRRRRGGRRGPVRRPGPRVRRRRLLPVGRPRRSRPDRQAGGGPEQRPQRLGSEPRHPTAGPGRPRARRHPVGSSGSAPSPRLPRRAPLGRGDGRAAGRRRAEATVVGSAGRRRRPRGRRLRAASLLWVSRHRGGGRRGVPTPPWPPLGPPGSRSS